VEEGLDERFSEYGIELREAPMWVISLAEAPEVAQIGPDRDTISDEEGDRIPST
jgi:hypothetical protein